MAMHALRVAALAATMMWRASASNSDAMSLLQFVTAAPDTTKDTFELGDKALIKLEGGPKRGSWVPCTVTKLKARGFYHVHVDLGPSDVFQQEIINVPKDVLRDGGTEHGALLVHYLQHDADARRALLDLEHDALRRVRAHYTEMGLNQTEIADKMVSLARADRAKKESLMHRRGCPAGFAAKPGDARGPDHYGRNSTNKQETVDLCALDCIRQLRCLSFEWNHHTKVCNANKVAEPDRPSAKDTIFCQRIATNSTSSV